MKLGKQFICITAALLLVSGNSFSAYKKSKAGVSAAYPAAATNASVAKIVKLGKTNSAAYLAKKARKQSKSLHADAQSSLDEVSSDQPVNIGHGGHHGWGGADVTDEFIVITPGGQVLSGNGATHGNAWWKNPATDSGGGSTTTTEPVSGTTTQNVQMPVGTAQQTTDVIEPQTMYSTPGTSKSKLQLKKKKSPRSRAYAVPYARPNLSPQATPGATPYAVPQATPYLVPQLTNQATPSRVPQAVPSQVPQAIPPLTPAQITQINNLNVNFQRQIVVVQPSVTTPNIPYQIIVTQQNIIFIPQYQSGKSGKSKVNVLNDFDSMNHPFVSTDKQSKNNFQLVISGAPEPTARQLQGYKVMCGGTESNISNGGLSD